jgi:two-component system CheB/CheR fusion protein
MARKKTRVQKRRPAATRRSTVKREASPVGDAPDDISARANFCVVGVGASAGGIEAFKELLRSLPDDLGMAFVVVQHLPPTRSSLLAEILSRSSRMAVTQVQDNVTIEANHVYVIPPGQGLTVVDAALKLRPQSPGLHRPIDDFLTSLADQYGHRAIGVILSGTATDGTLGLEAIKAAGGITFAQDESAQHEGMPRSAIGAGVVDFVLSPAGIAKELERLAQHPYVSFPTLDREAWKDDLDQVLRVLHDGSGIDFAQYKSNTLHRRITRRMVLRKFAKLDEYAKFLQQEPHEIEALTQDILISVTSFFRNPESFEALRHRVFPALFKDRSRKDPVRVWVLGCSTGEEAYSLAMALTEYAVHVHSHVPITLYATDLNGAVVEKARMGFYPRSVAQEVSSERLKRFFVEADGGFRVSKAIRDICIFARQNVLTDPPFSRMDMISCRNVMIYMEATLQRKLLPILHYALRPGGVLFLGPSESISTDHELFQPEDAKHRVYVKKPVPTPLHQSLPLGHYVPLQLEKRPESLRDPPRDVQVELQREADRILITRYVPAGVLVSADHDVIQFRGETGHYLAPAPGRASLNVLKMAREGLLVSLRGALQRARKEDVPVRDQDVRVRSNGGYRDIALTVIPVRRGNSRDRYYWVLFEEAGRFAEFGGLGTQETGHTADPAVLEEKDRLVQRLTQELAATREYLQSVIEQQEAANEELQSANEEVQSANEELQSINEELETSKEEIQSSNEELTTVNEELHNRNEELNRANNDLNNLFSSVQVALVMVWPDLRIRRFTPAAEKLFNLIAGDIGRPITDIKLNLNLPDLTQLLTDVIDTIVARELEVQDRQGRWYLLRIRPYRTMDNKIDGAVIALFDIDALRKNQEVLERQARLLEQAHEAVFVRELNGRIVYWNRGAEFLYGYPRDEARDRIAHELLGKSGERQAFLNETLEREGRWNGELEHLTKDGRSIVVDSIQVLFQEGTRSLVLETNRDVTERKRLEESLRRRVDELDAADRHKNQFLAMLAHELRNPLAPLRNAVQILKSERSTETTNAKAREVIDRQVGNMARLVEDLLDAARVTRGQVQLRTEPVVLQTVLERSIDNVRALIESRKHKLATAVPTEPVVLGGDSARLEQVFSNLLNNAAKYTPNGGAIDVTLETQPAKTDGGAEAVVHVRDNGIGIPGDMIARVFDLFVQADQSLARSQGGLGIGLSLARRLVEQHGGRVTAHSRGLGQGSEFTVYLPIAVPEADARAPAAGTAEEGSPDTGGRAALADSRVLVVDDSADIAETMAAVLILKGHMVQTASSGQAALDVAASFRPTTVLLDIGMPDLDGYTVAERLRRLPGLEATTFVAISGYGAAEHRIRAKEAGFDFYLVKPIDYANLEQLLQQSILRAAGRRISHH